MHRPEHSDTRCESLAVKQASLSSWAAEPPQWSRLVNVGLLIGGYGLGQGAIFAVQTWLVVQGQFDLLSAFGTCFSFAMLGIFVIDAGSTTTLAGQIARLSAQQASREIWPLFWATVVARVAAVVVVGGAGLVYVMAMSSDPFSRNYLFAILPGLAVWSGNAVGLLDGLKMSGLSGVSGALAFATSALALAVVPQTDPGRAGALLGAAFSAGYVLTVAVQWAALGRFGMCPRLQRPERPLVMQAFKDGLALLSQSAPGQLVLRIQLGLSAAYLGAEITALFVYTKQVIVAVTMLVGFIMRVDYPGLVQRMARPGPNRIGSIFEAQKIAVVSALVLTAGTLLACALAPLVPAHHLAKAARLLAVYAPSIITISALSIMMQGTAAIGDYLSGARIIAISMTTGMAVSYLAIGPFGIYGLLIGEVSFHLIGLGLLFARLRRL